jgi:hypothetical protein
MELEGDLRIILIACLDPNEEKEWVVWSSMERVVEGGSRERID